MITLKHVPSPLNIISIKLNLINKCPICGDRKFEFSLNPLGMFIVDARPAIRIPDLQQGRELVFVNCMQFGYYIFFKPDRQIHWF